MKIKLVYLIALLILTGCKTTVQHKAHFTQVTRPQVADELSLGSRPEIPRMKHVLDLSQKQKDLFLDYFNNNSKDYPSLRVYKYMQSHLQSASYSNITLPASEVLSQNSGNCLSLAILTKSLADVANIEIRYQMVKVPPVFQKSNDIIVSSQHIRSVLYNRKLEKDEIPGRKIKSFAIDYNPSELTKTLRWVSEDEFFSLYYTNRAAELLTENKINDAYWYLNESLKLKGSNIQSINMMGIVHNRLGYKNLAEEWYVYGLGFNTDQFEILKNYYALLKKMNRGQEAKKIALQLSQYNVENPFEWITLGDNAFDNKNYQLAIKNYKKASDLAKYLHEPYAGIARSQFMLGNTKKAYKAMKAAIKNTNKDEVLSIYQAKYESLSSQLNKR